ncbi:MAG: CapA family protein [Lachnospiraceae bacterium]|nr:CapA family protein [Lachnospiraceae bacterium]
MKKQKIYIVLVMVIASVFFFADKTASADEPETTTVTISAAGDCTFGSDVSSPSSVNFYAVYNKVHKDKSYFFRKVKHIFAKDDLSIVNFEGTLTKRSTREDKRFAFKGSPSYIDILKKGSIEAVSFANNHCRDFGSGSYTDTISAFKKAGIKYASYAKVSTYKTKGKVIGMVAVNGLESERSVTRLIRNGIKKLKKKKADIIIVSIHAGMEHTSELDSTQKNLSRYAVRCGADLVLGHHPHDLQGIEKYKGVYIVYSLANFCFGGNTDPVDKDTMIFQQSFVFRGKKLSKSKSKAKVIPCSVSSTSSINNYQPTVASGKNKQRILKKIDRYCQPLGVTLRDKNGKIGMELSKK